MSKIIKKIKLIENQKTTLCSITDWCCLPSIWFSLGRFYHILSVIFVDTANLIWFIPRFMPAENYSFTYLMLFNRFRINIPGTCTIDHWQCCLQKCNDSAFFVSQLNSNLDLRVTIQFNGPIRHYAEDTNSTHHSIQSGIPIPYSVKIFTVFNVAT